tara:strand:- start:345 stop:680 length:336 start_codon:yes stop_codon:yes gene_type:complete
MNLVLKENIDLDSIKLDLKNNLNTGILKNDYSFEINLIYKIIHEYSNYEDVQWILFSYKKSFVEEQLKSLLIDISVLDKNLTWDCLSILSRYINLYEIRHKIMKKYFRSNI